MYSIKKIPDLMLSKYQVFADSGVEGMLEAQTQFIRQLHRVSLLEKVSIHFLFYYDAKCHAGEKLHIELIFNVYNESTEYYNKIRKIVRSSGIYTYFQLEETDVENTPLQKVHFSEMSILSKKERFLQAEINGEEQFFYLVPNWEMKEDARLYSTYKLMESFDETCCYRVDLYTEENLDDQIHRAFIKPLSFLRNISNRRNGVSEYSRTYTEKKDPNIEETLRQYEDWLTAIDSSSIYTCRICSFAGDKQYGQLLLDTALSESLSKGNAVIRSKSGMFSAFDELNTVPIGYCSSDTPRSMNKWSVTFTVEEIAAFARLPVLYDGENIEFPKETAPVAMPSGIKLGFDQYGHGIFIPPKILPKHMFVCGVPGSGKTKTMLIMANSLWHNKVLDVDGSIKESPIPFLALEPAKREYRTLALLSIPDLVIFSPSACTDFPLRINPFEFPKGLTLSEHIGRLCQVFEGAFPIAPPAPFILDRAIQAVYEIHGWNTSDINTGMKPYPTMSELYTQFEKEVLSTHYDGELKGNIQSVLEMRIGSLLRREMKDIFDASSSTFPPEEWLKRPIIIELEALGEGPANFVTLLLCTLIRETLKANPLEDKEKPIRHVIFIEEAHNLISSQSQVENPQESNPKIAATSYIVKMLAEVRALREGIIIADQLPTAMAPEVIKNTNVKIVHRLTSGDDRELVGSTMAASPLQLENMATYVKGRALFTFEDMLRPFEIQVVMAPEYDQEAPSDQMLLELMFDPKKHPAYYDLRKNLELEKWDALKQKVSRLRTKEQEATQQLEKLDFSGYTSEQFHKCIDTLSQTLNEIEVLKKRYQYECGLIDDRFIDKSKKAKLTTIIQKQWSVYKLELAKKIRFEY